MIIPEKILIKYTFSNIREWDVYQLVCRKLLKY